MNVFTVLTNDGVEHVSGVFTDRERALVFAGEELGRMTAKHPVMRFAEDDAELYVGNVVFSQSCTVKLPEGSEPGLFGVLVQEFELIEGPATGG